MISNSLRSIIRSNLIRPVIRSETLARQLLAAKGLSTNPSNVNATSETTEPNQPNQSQADKPTSSSTTNQQTQEQIEQLRSENKTLMETVKELDDKYKRALAEAENTRIRSKKQLEDAKIYAIQAFCKDLLEVSDIFRAAIDSVKEDSLKQSTELKQLFDGVQMTEQKLMAVFQRHGLQQINPLGEKFDPNEHHALFQVSDSTKEPGTVSVVHKIGFKLHDRCIRPAMVGVVASN